MRAVQLSSEHLCPKHLGLGQEIRTVEGCGSDEWQISGHSVECPGFDLDRMSAITFRHPGMCLAFNVM